MLKWIVKPVESPYGTVDTLHWAVPDDEDETDPGHQNSASSSRKYEASSFGGDEDDEADAETALQVELESAEDQLGAVLWNSNTAALQYLHRHILKNHGGHSAEVAREGDPSSSSSSSSPPVSADKGALPLKGLRVVELGAGVGCLGIALAMGGAAVAITDLKELVPLMRHNVELNRRRWQGRGRCLAMEWKWGPSVSTNPKKYAKTVAQNKGSNGAMKEDTNSLEEAMHAALRAPSAPMRAALEFFSKGSAGATSTHTSGGVDYIVLCDALYGNPKDWPSLLYTLTEMMATNPERCTIVNFCEQRVNDVEGAFLELLREQNTLSGEKPVPSKSARDEREQVLQQVLLGRRGAYHWTFDTETLADAQSDLNMRIRATSIRWSLPSEGTDKMAPAPHDAEEPEKKRKRQDG